MKNRFICILMLGISSLISGVLISKMSLLGRVGISLVHKEYSPLKFWWKTALMLFTVQFFIYIILSIWHYKNGESWRRFILPIVLFGVGVVGLYYTYYDFTETSHRFLKLSFHSGFYLFWGTWFLNCLYFMIIHRNSEETEE